MNAQYIYALYFAADILRTFLKSNATLQFRR